MKVIRVPDRGLTKQPGYYYIEPVLEQLEYWGTNTDNDRMLIAAHVIRELLKIIEAGDEARGQGR